MAASGEAQDISLEKLQLNLENPRHEEKKSRDEAMIELLQNEKIEQLARDIVELGGINPMERLGIFPLKGSENIYVAAEGNRRQFSFDIYYSAQKKRMGKELLVASKGLKMIEDLRSRQIHRPQYRKKPAFV